MTDRIEKAKEAIARATERFSLGLSKIAGDENMMAQVRMRAARAQADALGLLISRDVEPVTRKSYMRDALFARINVEEELRTLEEITARRFNLHHLFKEVVTEKRQSASLGESDSPARPRRP